MPKNQKKLYTKIYTGVILAIIIAFFAYAQEKETSKNINQEPIPLLEQKKAAEIQTINSTSEKKAEPKREAESQKSFQEDTKVSTESVTILAGDVTVRLLSTPNTIFYD